MDNIDKELNKGIGKQNQADAMVLIKHDFSKLENDVDDLKSRLVTIEELIRLVIANQVRQAEMMCAPDQYSKLKKEIEKSGKNFINTQQVAACCGVSKPTALKVMNALAYKEPDKYSFRRCMGQAPSVIIKKKQVMTEKIRHLTHGAVTVGRDNDMKKLGIALSKRGRITQ